MILSECLSGNLTVAVLCIAKEQAKKEAEKSRLEAAKKEAETKQNALSTPRKGVPESPGGAQTPRSTPAQTAPPVQALTPGPTPSPSSVAMPSSAQAITAPGGSVNATEMSFVDSCVQLLDIMMSAPGVQFIGTSINGTPIPLHDALNVLKLKLLNGDYNLHDNGKRSAGEFVYSQAKMLLRRGRHRLCI